MAIAFCILVSFLSFGSGFGQLFSDSGPTGFVGVLSKVECLDNDSVVEVHLQLEQRTQVFTSIGLDCKLFSLVREQIGKEVFLYTYDDSIGLIQDIQGRDLLNLGEQFYIVASFFGGALWLALGLGLYTFFAYRLNWISTIAQIRRYIGG